MRVTDERSDGFSVVRFPIIFRISKFLYFSKEGGRKPETRGPSSVLSSTQRPSLQDQRSILDVSEDLFCSTQTSKRDKDLCVKRKDILGLG